MPATTTKSPEYAGVILKTEAAMEKTFETTLRQGFIELPFDARAEFGKARAPVKVSINGYRYATTVAVYGGKYMIPVRKDRQQAAGIAPGSSCKVSIAMDREAARLRRPMPSNRYWPGMRRLVRTGTR